MKRWLSEYVQKKYKKRATIKYLADKTDVEENTLMNYFYGKTPISLKVLLYFVFAFEMNTTDAFDFLNIFGYSLYSLYYRPYQDFIDLIGDYFFRDKYTPKDYVDQIIKDAPKKESSNQIN